LKTFHYHILKPLLSFFTLIFWSGQLLAQQPGRVVINEYMPWTLNGCGATAEFVELMNFGPGPINIGCYILTDGDFSVTIPPNTILQPGEFFLIAGQDVITAPCANIDSTVHADLNWNACGCTSGPIPTTGEGFFTDGGSANEQVVLLDPALQVVDAVVRSLPVEPSAAITTSPLGGCSSLTFDLDNIPINYEILGMSTGRGNSFARKLDGDCGWVKDPQQSGNATNNTPGETSNVAYSFSVVRSLDCDSTLGSIDVLVNVGSSTDVFPMNYTIAFDQNGDGAFDFSDTYTYGVDNTPPSIAISGLPLGRYRVTVSSSKGCFLRTFEFSILDCIAVLPIQFSGFRIAETKNNTHVFEWLLAGTGEAGELFLEESIDGRHFIPSAPLAVTHLKGIRHYTHHKPVSAGFTYYRLRLERQSGEKTYSPIVRSTPPVTGPSLWPNPIKEGLLSVRLAKEFSGDVPYAIYSLSSRLVAKGMARNAGKESVLQIGVEQIPPGIYQLVFQIPGGVQPIPLRFVKR
jgi:hypothetical protein